MAMQIRPDQIKNDVLEGLLQKFKTDQSKETLAQLMEGLKKTLVMQPALLPQEVEAQMKASREQGKEFKVDNTTRPNPLIIKNAQGNLFFLVFTSQKHMPKEQKYPMMVIIPFLEVAKMALAGIQDAKPLGNENDEIGEKKLSGVVINPFTDNLMINMPGLDAIVTGKALNPVSAPALSPEQLQAVKVREIALKDIPQAFFTEKEAFVDRVSAKKEAAVFTYYEKLAQDSEEEETAISEENIDVVSMYISDTLRMIRIGLPGNTKIVGSVRGMVLAYNPESEEGIVYVSQRQPGKEGFKLFQIDASGTMKDLGGAPGEGEEIYTLMGMIPWNQ